MKKLFKKQGFTLVEMIVVIAIMAILLAVLIPTFSSSRSFEQEAREIARSFYSNVQELMIDEMGNKTLLNVNTESKNSKYTLIYAKTTESADTTLMKTEVNLFFIDDEWGSSGYDSKDVKNLPTSSSDFKSVNDKTVNHFNEFSASLNRLLSLKQNSGYFYAVVDKNYRVVYTYYARNVDYDKLIYAKKKYGDFSADYQIKTPETNYIGYYPAYSVFQGWARNRCILPRPQNVAYHLDYDKDITGG